MAVRGKATKTVNKSRRMEIRLTDSEYHNVEYCSQYVGKTMSEFIREAVQRACDETYLPYETEIFGEDEENSGYNW